MIGGRENNARFQSDFYRDCYYKMLRWLIISICIILLLLLGIIYFIIFVQPQQYYATTTAGQIIPMNPSTG